MKLKADEKENRLEKGRGKAIRLAFLCKKQG